MCKLFADQGQIQAQARLAHGPNFQAQARLSTPKSVRLRRAVPARRSPASPNYRKCPPSSACASVNSHIHPSPIHMHRTHAHHHITYSTPITTCARVHHHRTHRAERARHVARMSPVREHSWRKAPKQTLKDSRSHSAPAKEETEEGNGPRSWRGLKRCGTEPEGQMPSGFRRASEIGLEYFRLRQGVPESRK